MYSHISDYRVRYADVDQMGYMYYGNYPRLYEIGRVEALRALGVRYRDLEESGVWMPVYENNSRYIRPAQYDELLEINCKLETLPGTRIIFTSEIRNEEKALIHVGRTTLVFLDSTTRKIIPCPGIILKKLQPHFACETG
ncbi:acyl-CoA thioesterase [Leadbetterella sp. DM7]|uniref:acyl-CoA thioesterase n=1 Tax=Leadbetterella sp. DM7 TaxID=3235085 RepID=UPI00349EBC2C